MLRVTCKGGLLNHTPSFLSAFTDDRFASILERYGAVGVTALSGATPKDTGRTGDMWRYTVERRQGGCSLKWYNDNVNDGVPIAIILQYGHGTGTGGYVEGTDYINPAMRQVFESIKNDIVREVTEHE